MGLFFFRTPKPRHFNHVPIYYDEAKEELENLKNNAELEVKGKTDKEFKVNVKGQFNKKRISTVKDFGQTEKKQSNLRLVLIIGFLLLLAYLILNAGGGWLSVFMPGN